MINKDFILRLAESFGRTMAIILGLREYNRNEEALIYIDDVFLKTVGLTSRFINSLSEEMLVRSFSPMGVLNIESCLWAALLLKAEGDIYQDMDNTTESYYRHLKALHLFLTAAIREPTAIDTTISTYISELLTILADYELPTGTLRVMFSYYEYLGYYARGEDTLFEMLEHAPHDHAMQQDGQAFYRRLLTKSDSDLRAGNFSRSEAEEGLAHLQQITSQDTSTP